MRANWRCGALKPRSSFPAHSPGAPQFAHSGTPADKQRVAEYEAGPYKGYGKKLQEPFAAIVPPDADAGALADAIVKVVDAPFGKRPFRVHIDPTQDGADVAFAAMDRVRTEMLHRVGLSELLTPARGIKNGKQRMRSSKVLASTGSWAGNGNPEVTPPGWQIAPDKRASRHLEGACKAPKWNSLRFQS
jgi:hypothetical protein